MKDALISIIKTFFEKSFIPTIVAIVFMCIGIYLTPDAFVVYQKLGSLLYSILLFTVSFLFVYFIARVAEVIKDKFRRIKYRKEKMQGVLEKIWKDIDNLSDDDYDLIVEFLKNNNKARQFNVNHYYDGFLFSDFFVKTKLGIEYEAVWGRSYMFQLEPGIYNLLMYSVYKYKKICNFKTLSKHDIKNTENLTATEKNEKSK